MLTITTDKDAGLLTARWNGPGPQEEFTHDDTALFYRCLQDDCWRWLVDLRHYGDLNEYNTGSFLRTRIPDTAWRAPKDRPLRVALLVGPGFGTVTAGVPDTGYQERHRFALRLFTDEGAAQRWLTESESAD